MWCYYWHLFPHTANCMYAQITVWANLPAMQVKEHETNQREHRHSLHPLLVVHEQFVVEG